MKKLGGEGAGGVSRRTKSGYRVADEPLGLIAGTPLVRLARLSPEGGATVWAKCEFMNPGGSVKDRAALAMILAAEDAGELKDGSVIIEPTSGNTGISLAMIAAQRGHRCMLVMPENMSMERRYIMKAYGAEIELTAAKRGMAGAVERARELVTETSGAFLPMQFENAANPSAHEQGTAVEILEQLGGEVAAFVAGVGTGGTVIGTGRALKAELSDQVRVIAAEPAASPVLSGGKAGPHGIPGTGAGFVPQIYDRNVVDEVVTVTDANAEKTARQLAQVEGLLVGPSSGGNVYAAIRVASEMKGGNVVTVMPDSGERYLI